MSKLFLETVDADKNIVLIEVKNLLLSDESDSLKIVSTKDIKSVEFVENPKKITKSLKQKLHKRLLIDMIIDNIKEIDSQINEYNKYMDDKSFDESDEVEALYNKLRECCLEMKYI